MRRIPSPAIRDRQRGVALIYGMISIVVLMISAAALMRGMDTATALAGNAGFHRDLVNESDRGIVAARDQFTNANGSLNTSAKRNAAIAAVNYSEVALPNDPNGIPLALIDDNQFAAIGNAADINDAANGVSIRYVIDRLCTQTGTPSIANCVPYTPAGDTKGSIRIQRAGAATSWAYRISVRVTGPKNAMTFVQTMIGA